MTRIVAIGAIILALQALVGLGLALVVNHPSKAPRGTATPGTAPAHSSLGLRWPAA